MRRLREQVGSNGAGKSTLLRIVAGMHMVPERAVLVHGRSAFHDTLFSNNNVAFLGDVWYRTVPFASGNVPYSADIAVWQMLNNYHGIDPERRDRLIDILEVNPEWRMHSVSDGERKRVMILLKLLRPCSILLLDEVTTNLDVIARQDFLNFLRLRPAAPARACAAADAHYRVGCARAEPSRRSAR